MMNDTCFQSLISRLVVLLSPLFLVPSSFCVGGESAPWWIGLDDSSLPGREEAVEVVIDHALAQKLTDVGIAPAEPASPETLLRRLTLDLVGRIPTLAESGEMPPAVETADRLLGEPGYERFLAEELNWLLLDGKNGDFRKFLQRAVAQEMRWDEIFTEVVTARPDSEFRKGVDQFVRERVQDQDKLTNDVSVRFFGVNVSCAQCHNHPYVKDWTQDTYYGMKSFFSRTFENGGFVAEREYGLISYKTTEGEERKPELRFLGGPALTEPEHREPTDEEKKLEKAMFEDLKKKKELPPAPNYGRRARVIEAGLSGENDDYLARSLVNQVWNRFFERGLVMPLDQMHGENLPSHPVLLQWLARDLVEHDYDLRRLIRGIVLSQAYQRSSSWESSERPDPELFAVMTPRPLNPRQYGISIKIGAANPDYFPANLTPEEWEKRIEQTERNGEGMARWFQRPGGTFHFSVDEALYFSNSDDARNQALNGGLVSHLEGLKTVPEQIESAYRSVLSRHPEQDEIDLFSQYLSARTGQTKEALGQMVWTLITSSEMRFNH